MAVGPGEAPVRSGRGAMWVVAFGVFVAADDLMVVATMLRPIMDDLGLILPDDLDATTWIVNVYLIAYIAAMPIAGKLSDMVGRRAVFVGSLGLFATGSLIVPNTDSLGLLLVGRAVSALGGGALVPVALAVASDLYVGARRTQALGVLSGIETLGWVWGPLYGALLVRLLSWQWQFHLNVPLALLGIVAGWLTLDPTRRARGRIDWLGAGLLTLGLVALNLALLGQAGIQSVSGLEELQGSSGTQWWNGPWLYGVALVAGLGFVGVERWNGRHGRVEPIIGGGVFRGRAPTVAMAVNGLVGVGLVVALVNVPLFVNIVDSDADVGSTALLAGGLLTSLTASMAATSYIGGRWAGISGNTGPTVSGLCLALVGFVVIGLTWSPDTSNTLMAIELAVIGGGIGLVLAPTSAAVVDAAAESERGSAAGLIIVFRLIGFSVGLAGLTAWGLHRYNELRSTLELPALGSDGFEDALATAAIDVTTTALAETFIGAAAAFGLALCLTAMVRPGRQRSE